jgi:hypothetical protein
MNLTQPAFNLTPPQNVRNPMRVTKRSGLHEPIDLNKIVRAVTRCSEGIQDVDPMRIALKTIAGLYDGATTRELDELSIRTCRHSSIKRSKLKASIRSHNRFAWLSMWDLSTSGCCISWNRMHAS